MRHLTLPILGCTLALALACGGGRPPGSPAGPGLDYRDPGGVGWTLKRNPASTPERLLLDLVPPPTETSGRGVVLELELQGEGARWVEVAPGDPAYVRNGPVYDLGAGVPALAARPFGTHLKVVDLQKGRNHPAAYTGQGVLTVALALSPDDVPPEGASIGLKVIEAYHLPAQGAKVDISGQVLTGTLVAGRTASTHKGRYPVP